ncbi:phosphoribosylaminoimidazolecarboxamide formyltransferase/IMP cyclohydrolase [Clostridium acetobutylicum]|uniref:AICAR transformylase domain of PurH-like protein n=1 Tax=Clostridium acetobutylicum (strain ATCC 824 / DSM 792 / JCM 1419 / IAM 19013 / LMG 5710 / NBRC 13948 / NRRL B-527 / VKM B-1787 / 2291 / W) TaxID=272562 RepID=Q97GC3_CLOAB|nr:MULTISPECIES: phosphoribosylaminoimidazolecarboxamide formyltransferase [Clostridium]AAK80399.1 AICAR transformylase domain of PurH-like protein [Clostridium acetobutylicum ATCC 824]ADZ21496.1 5-aminoimidazole-4-carboxamide ribonucleotide transformylase [Clostridium acetobutylicum EA 2018]AEI34544.1 5-aminoimidazole-4-carboxamide ribonucleotide transformylase [Clostridium acetobutylicum DSM 1731]AWV79183.1 phosphoribosylaminoimidazolecarboxamide formyltransferase [Clostridium acetobutylicum]
MKVPQIELKYGCNPNQSPARIYVNKGVLPIEVLNGKPGYINFMDALNSWQLVKELKKATGLTSAASFKHVSPAGAATAVPLSDTLKKSYLVEDIDLTPAAIAYSRARGADRMSSYGDFAAISDKVDVATATILKKSVSDGIIAPDYDPKALEILKSKKNGKYNIIKIDPDYEPINLERREIYGITFEQKRNITPLTENLLENIVTKNKNLTKEAKRDLIICMITLKYTQSNSVCFALDGQVIGVGAGQQSRIHCTRLAASKADIWYLRQHPYVLTLPFKEGVSRPDRDNLIDQYLRDDVTEAETFGWSRILKSVPKRLSAEEKTNWLSNLKNVSLGSDAFFPFSDNIDRASKSGVKYIVQPGGSIRDDIVIEACDNYNMIMAFSGTRLFHH